MIEWTLTGMSLLGTWLNIQKKVSCWLIWSIANIGWAISFSLRGMYAETVLFGVYLILSTYGWLKWYKEAKKGQFN